MSESLELAAWVRVAEEDYSLARVTLRRKAPLTYGACFHAQQCAEKSLKAALAALKQPFPHVHDLTALSDLCTRSGFIIGMNADDLDSLSSYAVRARYPGQQPTLEEAREAIRIATTVRRLLRRYLGLDVGRTF